MLNQIFHALADPARRTIVERLAKGPAAVSVLAEPLDMSLPAVMQHLAVLEESGLVRSEKIGRVRTCRLETAKLKKAEEWLASRRTVWEASFDRLADFLDEQEGKKKR